MAIKTKGFTLIELLVVIAIIGVLASLLVVAFNSVRTKSRDGRRIADIKQIRTALDAYYLNNNGYPAAITAGQSLADANNIYLAQIPNNPLPAADGACAAGNEYTYANDCSGGYTLTYCLGSAVYDATAGNCTAVAGQICQKCGYTVSYNNVDYGTAWIDINGNGAVDSGECWFKDSLRTNKKPDCTTALTHGTSGDYLYPPNIGNTAEETNSDYVNQLGYLYNWTSAMNSSTSEGAQGLCPTGWHIPSDTELYNLENYLKTPGQTCTASRTAGWECSGAGSSMKEVGTNGTSYIPFKDGNTDAANTSTMTIRAAGFYNTVVWGNRGLNAYLWSSTPTSTNAFARYFGRNSNSGIVRSEFNKVTFFSIRCVKN